MSGRGGRLASLLLAGGEGPLKAVVADGRTLRRRLLLAEIVAPPPSLRRPGERTPLAPRADAAPDGD